MPLKLHCSLIVNQHLHVQVKIKYSFKGVRMCNTEHLNIINSIKYIRGTHTVHACLLLLLVRYYSFTEKCENINENINMHFLIAIFYRCVHQLSQSIRQCFY